MSRSDRWDPSKALDPMEPFTYSTIALESRRFESTHRTTMQLRHELGYKHKFSEYQDEIDNLLVRKLHSHIWSHKDDTKKFRHPADWAEAFKERWFPKWALKRWPVKYATFTFEAVSVYPTIKVAKEDHKAVLHIVSCDGLNRALR